MKKLLLSLLLLVVTINVGYAQRQQTTKDFVAARFPDLPFTEIKGSLTYQYIIGNNGDHILDGTYTVKCQQGLTDKSGWISRGTYKISGSYNVNTTFSKGLLNGPLTISRKAYAKLEAGRDRMESDCNYTLTAAFSNGVPNGTFKLTFLGDQSKKGNLIANYRDGALIGAYSYDYNRTVYKGNFNSSGDFIGSWNLNGAQAQFENGVLISLTDNYDSTKPAISAAAKKYANGQLSQDDLYELGYWVETKNVNLSDMARDFVLEICEEPIDGRYPKTDNPTYTYLSVLPMLTEAGVDELINCIINRHNSNKTDLNIHFNGGEYDCILENYKGYYFVKTLTPCQNTDYVTIPHQYNAFITYDQLDRIQSTIDTYLSENRLTTLYKYFQLNCQNDAKLLEAYLGARTTNASSKLQHLIRCGEMLTLLLSSYESTSKPHLRIEGYNMFNGWLIDDSSKTEFKEFLDKLNDETSKVELQVMTENLTKSINWIKEYKTASAMYWKGNMSKAFFSTRHRDDPWEVYLMDNIKPFCPIFDIEIVSINPTDVVVNIKKGKKENKLTTYQIELKHSDGKFHAESFSINKAKLIQ